MLMKKKRRYTYPINPPPPPPTHRPSGVKLRRSCRLLRATDDEIVLGNSTAAADMIAARGQGQLVKRLKAGLGLRCLGGVRGVAELRQRHGAAPE
jgi:hypothetical protein